MRTLVIAAAALLVAVLAYLIVPLWLSVVQFGLPVEGWLPVGLTVVLCFAIGGVLMALIFISSRRGYDEAAHSASLDLEDEGDPRAAHSEPPPAARPPFRKS